MKEAETPEIRRFFAAMLRKGNMKLPLIAGPLPHNRWPVLRFIAFARTTL